MSEYHNLPKHIAIIMDGNNRWAKSRLLGGIAGHKAGKDAVRTVVEECARLGVKVLTLFAFSSENWRRPKDEVTALMELFLLALKKEVRRLHKNNIRLVVIGDKSGFNERIQHQIREAESLTCRNTAMTLAVAANYGGQWDIAQAAKKLACKVREGTLEPEDISAELISQEVCLAEFPAPDLCIRTAGEQRISNFLLWQFAYTEFYFTDVYWPDFGRAELHQALTSYASRIRRFGRTDDQVEQLKELQCSNKE
ncbi:isoprenyl transferase [Gynuella sunshinyii]|uniref:Ditrans,polycis-undecaprenyl-diphosphate synthase ((2E,6E)-farnesyl-diphosphate specific) n=1 Tax=Gynuella sunshinyii YC6258 TaxID=1445510 RepID=A0A0C5VJ42_9GAMM|nr:isoprenyl transferase [Gynuella sunshinyii]AJQ94677.1 undecaprenyl pyrophosphate synthase [Gynuella sunshinyii YC6258]